jgi:hypothetical protein
MSFLTGVPPWLVVVVVALAIFMTAVLLRRLFTSGNGSGEELP